MPVNTTHAAYGTAAPLWARCRDAIEGEDCVKERAEEAGYLPRLEGQSDRDYEGYLTRAMFHNAAGRTIVAVVGAIFRRQPVIEPQPKFGDEDLSNALTSIAKEVVKEIASVGRVGVMCDLPQDGGLPYLAVYRAESIINWRYTLDGDKQRLTLVVLREATSKIDPQDEFSETPGERFRVLRLVDNVYVVELYEWVTDAAGQRQLSRVSVVVPLALGERIAEIPFVIIGPARVSADVSKPPLLDLVNVNMSHFRSSADLEHGRHFTALPTPWVAGFSATTELRIGAGAAWVSDNPQAHAGFLEFSGAGLAAIDRALEHKEHLMAVHGARLFEPSREGVESAEALRIRQSSDTATAVGFADSASEGLTTAYRWLLGFIRSAPGASGKARFDINKDIIDTPMDPAAIASLVSSWQAGAISLDTLLAKLKEGEVIPPERSIEEEKDLISVDDERLMRGEFALDKELPAKKKG